MSAPNWGLLQSLWEIQQIQQATGCSSEDAWEQWHREREKPESNIVYVDFRANREE